MKPFIKFFSSLELVIACMVLGLVLVFVGTIDQVNLGIHGATERYFYSFFVMWKIPNSEISIPYLPGGYTVGITLLVNLITGLFVRFRYSWKKTGVLMIHFGVISLLIGELVSSMMQVDSNMAIDEGATVNYSEDRTLSELVVIDHSHSATTDRVYAFPKAMLKTNHDVKHDDLPFSISINQFMTNSVIQRRDENTPAKSLIANKDIGLDYYAIETPKTGKMDEINRNTAILTIFDSMGNVAGTWLTSLAFPSQEFSFEGKDYSLQLRNKRYYHPFEIKLIDFSFDRYLGTNIPMNYSSMIELTNQERGEKREFLIYMNHPLRYNGLTFFQSSFTPDELTTILQVVSNPGRYLPYISCILIFVGLTVQFGTGLITFIGRRLKKS
ncbi:MAG: cytochrome c biogenesis protein ResB [Opitutaceae bacterium]|nr:cytochrome c biogenesis protein ResB [Opitutaceae bacterium]